MSEGAALGNQQIPWWDLEEDAYERRMTAYHEAGHAVVGMLFGRAIDELTIEPDEERRGFASTMQNGMDALVNVAIDVAAYAATRVAAEKGAIEDCDMFGVAADYDHALLVLDVNGITGDAANDILSRVEGGCRRLLHRHWRALDAIARALEERGALDHDGAMVLVGDWIPEADPWKVDETWRKVEARRTRFAKRAGVPLSYRFYNVEQMKLHTRRSRKTVAA